MMMRDMLKKLMAEKEGMPSEKDKMKYDIKKKLLEQLSSEMGAEIVNPLKEMPKASVTVASSDPKKLPEALEEAKELVQEVSPLMEKPLDIEDMTEKYKKGMSSEDAVEKEDDKEKDLKELLESLDPDMVKKLLSELL